MRLKVGGSIPDRTASCCAGAAPDAASCRHERRARQTDRYSCSGCSSAAQLAIAVALKLDRAEVAEMSCIAGVGGDVPSLLRTAKSGRPIVALDGCALACVKCTLSRHGMEPTLHVTLSDHGVGKRYHADFDPAQAQRVFADVGRQINRRLAGDPAPSSALVRPPAFAQVDYGLAAEENTLDAIGPLLPPILRAR